jgi:hypothetical protein
MWEKTPYWMIRNREKHLNGSEDLALNLTKDTKRRKAPHPGDSGIVLPQWRSRALI